MYKAIAMALQDAWSVGNAYRHGTGAADAHVDEFRAHFKRQHCNNGNHARGVNG